jgi:hypothetical protein
MKAGILVVESADHYQIIDEVDSPAEARSLARGYFLNAQEYEMLVPVRFVIVRRDSLGFYTRREIVPDLPIETYPTVLNGKPRRVTIPENEPD